MSVSWETKHPVVMHVPAGFGTNDAWPRFSGKDITEGKFQSAWMQISGFSWAPLILSSKDLPWDLP